MENNTPTQPNYYGVLPAPVRYSKELSASEKVLYAEISALSNTNGYCWASNAYFANLYSVEERQITRWVSGLSKSNFVRTETIYIAQYNKTERRIYLIDLPKHDSHPVKKDDPTPSKKTTPPRQKRQEPPVKKDGHNTTTNNTRTENSEEDTNVSSSSLPPSESAGADSSAGTPQSEEQESQPQAKSAASKDKEFVKSLFIEKLGELKKITIAGLPPKKTMLEKIEAIGEDMYWQYAQKINTESAKVVKGFTATLDNWLILKNEGWDALKGLNDFWKKQHGSSYKEVEQFAKGEKLALNSIGAFLSAKSKEKGAIATLQQVSAKFFEHLPSKWRDLQWFKLNTIANDLPAIYALIKNSAAKHATQEEKPETLLKDEHMAIIRRQANTRAINKRSSLVHKIALVEGVFPTFCRNILNEVVPENCEWSAIKNHPLAKEIFDAI